MSLLFLVWVGILFLWATSQISTGVAVRSQLTRLCDEIAVNVSVAGVDREQLEMDNVRLDRPAANAIAAEAFRRAGVQGVTFTIEVVNGEIVVRATLGNITVSSAATPRKVRN
ncbi:MAG: hypothetical protein DDT20_01915 [Firmicutes bacterium]|nr:hypothetical protein [Bacillota bacterium]